MTLDYGRGSHATRRLVRRAVVALLMAGACAIAAYWIYYAVIWHDIPSGVHNPTAWRSGEDGQALRSPDGSWTLRVRFNDGGAMHSGNFWTWVVAKDRWGREQVVAERYSPPQVRYGDQPLPARWIDNATVDVDFLPQRYSAPGVLTRRVVR